MKSFIVLHILIYYALCKALNGEKPLLVPSIKSIDLRETNNFVFPCNLASGSTPLTFRWYKNDQPFNQDFDLRRGIEVTEKFSMLTLKNISKNDSGEYRCQVSNVFGSDSSISVLTVKGSIDVFHAL